MTLSDILFLILATVVAVSALAIVFTRHIVHAAVWLLATLVGISFLYFLLGAAFLGAAQLIVYVGGTMVLVIFGVMLTAQEPFLRFAARRREWLLALFLAGGMFGILVYASLQLGQPSAQPNGELPGVGPLGLAFLGVPNQDEAGETSLRYLLPFEIISVHLLVVLIGAAYLARAKRRPPSENLP